MKTMNACKSKFPFRLKSLMRERKIKVREMAAVLDTTYVTIIHYRRGQTEPSISRLIEIANFFDVTVDYLVGNDENRE